MATRERLKVGAALQRWIDGDCRGVTGRVTFQLEMVYTTKTNAAGMPVRYGPYGPYWYVYWYSDSTRLGAKSYQHSKYVGKPDKVDPSTMTARQLATLIRQWPRV